jgi:type I restriction enzyme M protein
MSSNQSGEGDIRRALIEADLVDCMITLPGELFYSTPIPVCLWFLSKSKAARVIKSFDTSTSVSFRERRRETLFIDARKMGKLVDRVHRELTDADHGKIVNTYHAWRGDVIGGAVDPAYHDIAGFCKSASTTEIASHGYILTPGRYVGAEEVDDDGESFEEKMPRLAAELTTQFSESAKMEHAIKANLTRLGYGNWPH